MSDKIVGILVALLVGIVIIRFFLKADVEIFDFTKRSLCENSIAEANKNLKPKFDCEAKLVTIQAEEFVSEPIGDEVKKKLADKFIECFEQVTTSSGKYYAPYGFSYSGRDYTGVYCLICSVIEFKDIPNFSGLYKYMSLTHALAKQTYWERYAMRKLTPQESQEFALENDKFDTSRKYAILWRVSQKHMGEYVPDIIVPNEIMILPYDELLPDTCTYVMN
ncbi:MAG: hypothetical protein ABIG95_05855 [Candidatus Woesearchaeota archaeon]